MLDDSLLENWTHSDSMTVHLKTDYVRFPIAYSTFYPVLARYTNPRPSSTEILGTLTFTVCSTLSSPFPFLFLRDMCIILQPQTYKNIFVLPNQQKLKSCRLLTCSAQDVCAFIKEAFTTRWRIPVSTLRKSGTFSKPCLQLLIIRHEVSHTSANLKVINTSIMIISSHFCWSLREPFYRWPRLPHSYTALNT